MEYHPVKIEGEDLKCPTCGSEFLHHREVTAFSRSEGADNCVVTTIGEGGDASVSVSPNDERNPSDRRHGLAITLHCEVCHALSELTVAQHKGQTKLMMRKVGSRPAQ